MGSSLCNRLSDSKSFEPLFFNAINDYNITSASFIADKIGNDVNFLRFNNMSVLIFLAIKSIGKNPCTINQFVNIFNKYSKESQSILKRSFVMPHETTLVFVKNTITNDYYIDISKNGEKINESLIRINKIDVSEKKYTLMEFVKILHSLTEDECKIIKTCDCEDHDSNIVTIFSKMITSLTIGSDNLLEPNEQNHCIPRNESKKKR